MTKQEFLSELREQLAGLPKEDIEDRLNFYAESIDDRIDDGKSEEEAVNELGSIDSIIKEIAAVTPFKKIVKEKIKPKRRIRGWEVALIIVSFPIWLPLTISALVVTAAAFIVLWALVIASYAIETGLVSLSVTCGVAFAASCMDGDPQLAVLGASILALAGACFAFIGCVYATKLNIALIKKLIIGIKAAFIRKRK